MTENARPQARLATRIVRGVVVCIAGFACLYGMAVFFLLLPESKSVLMERRARRQMLDIQLEIIRMLVTENLMPMSLQDVLQHAERSGDPLTGIDPWDTPYLVEAIRDPAYSTSSYRMNVRSFGPNRRDDLGKKDDLQISTPGWVQAPPDMEPPRKLGESAVAP